MSDVKWIKIVTDIFDDEKMYAIETLPDGLTMEVVWFKILCLAGKCNNNGFLSINNKLAYTDEMLAKVFRLDIGIVQRALDVFQRLEMIEMVDNAYMVSNWLKYQSGDKLEDIRAKGAKRQREFRERQKQKRLEQKENEDRNVTDDVTSDVTVTQNCSYSISDSLSNNIYNTGSNNNTDNKNRDIDIFFETIWKAYPKKKGKGSVSKSKKAALYKIGEDQMLRCIERYRQEIVKNGTQEQYIMHGSTFFNSGYVDYLDENYGPDDDEPEEKGGIKWQ